MTNNENDTDDATDAPTDDRFLFDADDRFRRADELEAALDDSDGVIPIREHFEGEIEWMVQNGADAVDVALTLTAMADYLRAVVAMVQRDYGWARHPGLGRETDIGQAVQGMSPPGGVVGLDDALRQAAGGQPGGFQTMTAGLEFEDIPEEHREEVAAMMEEKDTPFISDADLDKLSDPAREALEEAIAEDMERTMEEEERRRTTGFE